MNPPSPPQQAEHRRRRVGLALLAGLILWPLVHRPPPTACPPCDISTFCPTNGGQ